jgi:hypothetical protein
MVAILFEGKSDKEFFDSLLTEYNLPKDQVIFKNFEGKDKFFDLSNKHYNDIEADINAGKIEKVLLVVDADNENDPNPNRGYASSEKKLQETIKSLGFQAPVEYHIMCDEKQEGNLESFLLSVLDEEQKKCVDSFKKCYKYELTDKWAYNTFYKQKRHPFDYNHRHFDLLKVKLTNLFQQ